MTDHDDAVRLEVAPDGNDREPRSGARARIVVVVAAVALVVGALAVVQQGGDDPAPEPDPDEESLDLEPTVLQLLGPRDGNDSIGLPIMIEPATGLTDGTVVTATSGGFLPGEGVGIVQCADAAPDEPGNAIDLCNISGYTALTASTDGIASGGYTVHRVLTTPRSGTVDCATEVRRCFLAMGAINDYDRSGGFELEFALDDPPTTGPPPPAVVGPPSASAVPSVGLADGDVVHLTASGLVEGERLEASLCAVDPQVCWPLVGPEPTGDDPLGLTVAVGGYLEASLQVWRFLPGPDAGTYVDCAVSECGIQLSGGTVPNPLALGFSTEDPAPTGPVIDVVPSDDLAIGDLITIGGAGFASDQALEVEICAQPADDDSVFLRCVLAGDALVTTDGDGAFSTEVPVPNLDLGTTDTTSSCVDSSDPAVTGGCAPPTSAEVLQTRCDGVETSCLVRASVSGALGYGRPTFPSPAVPISFSTG